MAWKSFTSPTTKLNITILIGVTKSFYLTELLTTYLPPPSLSCTSLYNYFFVLFSYIRQFKDINSKRINIKGINIKGINIKDIGGGGDNKDISDNNDTIKRRV
jgi:hypothetical protein